MHGRDTELGTLQQALVSLRAEPRLLAFTVVAEAGLGKSRLLQAFSDTCVADAGAQVRFRGRALPGTQDQPFGLLRNMLASWCGWTDLDAPDSTRARFEQALLPHGGPPDGDDATVAPVHRLGYLIGLGYADSPHVLNLRGDPRQIRQRGLEAALRLIAQPHASGSPALLQIEDLHWADNESLDFLQHLLDTQTALPMLVLCSTRPALFERRPGWAAAAGPDGQQGRHRRLALAPLDRAASRGLADELLSPLATVPPALRELVAGGADGNPFHMEQLVGLLIDTGALRLIDGAWAVDGERLLATPWPTTLTGVLQARLAALPVAQRRALQQASVIGPDFSGQALQVLGGRGSLSLPASMTRAAARFGAADDPSGQTPEAREFSFRHQVLQQVAYNNLPTRSKRALHKRLALWFSGLVVTSGGHALGATADHFERAGEAFLAAEHHAQAADRAADRFAHDAALAHVQRALALLTALPAGPGPSALRWQLLERREYTFNLLARRAEQRAAIVALAAEADAVADDRRRAEAANRLSRLCCQVGDYAGQQAASRKALILSEQAGDTSLYLRALRELGDSHCKRGDWDAGQRVTQQCLELARAQGQLFAQAQCLNTLAQIALQRQDPVGRLHLNEQELVLRKQLDDRRSEAIAFANLGGGWLDLGELFLARRYNDEALRQLRAMGNRLVECGVLCTLSRLESWLGGSAQALNLAHEAVQAAKDAGSQTWEAYALGRVGDCQLALGQHAAAKQAYEGALAVEIEFKELHQFETIACLARLALVQGDFTTAMQQVQRVLDHEAATGMAHGAEFAVRVDLICHLVLASVDDPRATDWLERAHGQLQSTASRIDDPALRRGFLGNIPEHRAVTTAWAAAQDEAAAHAALEPPPSSAA